MTLLDTSDMWGGGWQVDNDPVVGGGGWQVDNDPVRRV